MTDRIDFIRNTLFKEKFVNELTVLERDNEELSFVQDRVDNLNKIITFIEKSPEDDEDKKLDVLELSKKFMYKKPWSSLPDIHKFNKIREFVLNIDMDKTKRKEIFQKLKSLLHEKKLSSSKDVVYNQFEGMIEKIKLLEYNEENKEWKINSPKEKTIKKKKNQE